MAVWVFFVRKAKAEVEGGSHAQALRWIDRGRWLIGVSVWRDGEIWNHPQLTLGVGRGWEM